jgi:aminomethyltransferase
VEIAAPVDAARAVWDALLAAGVEPAGLGARDTLRLEAGLPLHGHELGPGITPLQANLGWVVGWDKADFTGKAALLAERAAGPARLLKGMVIEGRQPARDGTVVSSGGAEVGVVTSGNFSPMLETAIALGFLSPTVAVGDAVTFDVRGKTLTGAVVKLPFVEKRL